MISVGGLVLPVAVELLMVSPLYLLVGLILAESVDRGGGGGIGGGEGL